MNINEVSMLTLPQLRFYQRLWDIYEDKTKKQSGPGLSHAEATKMIHEWRKRKGHA